MLLQLYKNTKSILKVLLIILFLTGCKNENPITKWEGGIIPYYFKGNFSNQDIATIEDGMKRWEQTAGVDFQKVTPRAGAYRIEKVSDDKWQSSIGENNSFCYMIFGSGGDALEHIIHELGHGLGLLHEHQRPDREKYIIIVYSNILQSFVFNFEAKDNPLITEVNYAYDYQSVMHYGNSAFSANGSDTIVLIDSGKTLERALISTIDAAKAQEIYGPPFE